MFCERVVFLRRGEGEKSKSSDECAKRETIWKATYQFCRMRIELFHEHMFFCWVRDYIKSSLNDVIGKCIADHENDNSRSFDTIRNCLARTFIGPLQKPKVR